MLRTVVRDCLYLNWALPVESLPEPPDGLRYQLHSWQGGDYVFASALLFHHDAVHLSALPLLRVGYPQLNLRLYVLDGSGTPSVLFRRMLMPAWVAPGVRLVTHQPAGAAKLDFPRPSRNVGEGGPWTWRVEREGCLEVRAWQDSPMVGEGPRLGDWEQTVRYFQERPRGYAEDSGSLRRIDARRHTLTAVWPLRAEVAGEDLFSRLFALPATAGEASGNGAPAWPALHSAWLCPEIPFVFELGTAPQRAAVPQVIPQPVAGRVTSPVCREEASGRPGLTGCPQEGRRATAGAVLASAA